MDALKLLKQDHDEVKKMLADLESTTERAEKTRTEGLATLKAELEVHEAIEEEIFYPALKEHPKTKEITLEAARASPFDQNRNHRCRKPTREGIARRDQAHGVGALVGPCHELVDREGALLRHGTISAVLDRRRRVPSPGSIVRYPLQKAARGVNFSLSPAAAAPK